LGQHRDCWYDQLHRDENRLPYRLDAAQYHGDTIAFSDQDHRELDHEVWLVWISP
jgi:hypothetical protein